MSAAAELHEVGPWSRWLPAMRDPDEETEDYPGLVVHDGRVSGSITAGRTRLPLWAFAGQVVATGWGNIEEDYPSTANIGADGFAGFIHNLLQQRGDLGRLLCVLADVERVEGEREDAAWQAHLQDVGDHNVCSHEIDDYGWWQYADLRSRVVDALQRCLTALTEETL